MSDLDDTDIREIFDLVIESQRRCAELRFKLLKGAMTEEDAIRAYAIATAPLASAAKRIEVYAERPQIEKEHPFVH